MRNYFSADKRIIKNILGAFVYGLTDENQIVWGTVKGILIDRDDSTVLVIEDKEGNYWHVKDFNADEDLIYFLESIVPFEINKQVLNNI